MPPENVAGLVIVVIIAIALQFVFMAGEEDEKNRQATPVSHLRDMLELTDNSMWSVTIMRRSGYVQSAWHVPGSRYNALDLALEKMRSARIDMVEVVCNKSDKFEARAFYGSTGARRTGKYIGGIVITPV